MSKSLNGSLLQHRAAAPTSGPLFEPVTIGRHSLKTRLVYAPLTRCRAIGNVPQPAAAEYYSQRAGEGVFMLSEAAAVSQQGIGFPNVPGIFTAEQVTAWKPIVKAAKDKGAAFWMQLWHAGRATHNDYQPDGALPVAPSALAITNDKIYAPKSGQMVEYPVPRALEATELPAIAADFAQAARNALAAGFDGVEIHAANGYLLDQFLKQSTNQRTDQYGGSIENRICFVLEVGIRISPYATVFNQCHEPDVASTIALHSHLLRELSRRGLAYAHIVTARAEGSRHAGEPDLEAKPLAPFREAFTSGRIIAAGGYLKQSAEEEIRSGSADLVAFGRWWLANPDFVERLRQDKPLNQYNRATFYIQDQRTGYIDYPFLKDIPADAPVEKHYSGQLVFAANKRATAAPSG